MLPHGNILSEKAKDKQCTQVVIFETNEIIATWSCVNCYINSSLFRGLVEDKTLEVVRTRVFLYYNY